MKIFELHFWGWTLAPTYYGLMYALAFVALAWYTKHILRYPKIQRENLLVWMVLGVIVWGRLGYVFFYHLPFFIQHPLEIFKTWKGGMSFHGGLLGVIFSGYLFARKYKINFWQLMDDLALITPIGLFLGRIGNYLNQELLGWPGYSGFLAIEKSGISYFPTPLLEALLEGCVLGIILWCMKKYYTSRNTGQIGAIFLVGYGIFRWFAEFVRIPDPQLGYLGGWTLGQMLSVVMICVGVGLFLGNHKKTQNTRQDPPMRKRAKAK